MHKVCLRFLVLTGAILGTGLLFSCNSSGTSESGVVGSVITAPAAQAKWTATANLTNQGTGLAALKEEIVSFQVCGESQDWVRPPKDQQRSKWWSNPRYQNARENYVEYPWTHNFFVVYGTSDLEFDLANLSGLWSLPGNVRKSCVSRPNLESVLKLEKAELWVLLHRVKEIRFLNGEYIVIVEPTRTGAQFVQFPRFNRGRSVFRIVDPDMRVIDILDESSNTHWPY